MLTKLPSGKHIVFIPKNATSSIRKGLNWDYEKEEWHHRLDIPDEIKGNMIAVVRDPLERFISCATFLNNRIPRAHFKPQTYMSFFGRYPLAFMEWHFKPQHEFIQNVSWYEKFYYMSELPQLFQEHGLGHVHHENVSGSKPEITQDIVDWVRKTYAKDYELLNKVDEHRKAA